MTSYLLFYNLPKVGLELRLKLTVLFYSDKL